MNKLEPVHYGYVNIAGDMMGIISIYIFHASHDLFILFVSL